MRFNDILTKINVIIFYTFLFLSALNSLAGTGDFAGGGNGSKNKVYESNIASLVKLPAYVKRVQPLMEKFDKLMNELSRNDSKSTFSYSEFLIKMKLWYFAEDTLKSIDKETLGIVFSEGKTQQIALNKKREIWIDNKIFEKMKEEHQADLIVHEIVMNLYFLKYYSFYDICILSREMGIYDQQDENNLSCDQVKDVQYFNSKEPMALNEDDYQNIRRVTDWFLKELKAAKANDLYSKLIYNGFDKRFISKAEPTKEIEIKGGEIEKVLLKSFITDNFPDSCKNSLSNATMNCRATLSKSTSNSVTFNKLAFTLTDNNESKVISFNISSSYSKHQTSVQTHQGVTYFSVSFQSNYFPLEITHELGQKFYFLNLLLAPQNGLNVESSEIIGYSITPMVITHISPPKENSIFTECETKKLNPQKHPSFLWARDKDIELITDMSIKLFYFSKSFCTVRTPEQIQKEANQNKKNIEIKQKADQQLQPLVGKTFEFKDNHLKWGKEITNLTSILPQPDYFESQIKACISGQKDKNKECIAAKSFKILSLNTLLINNRIQCNINALDSTSLHSSQTRFHSRTGFKIFFACSDSKFEVIGLPYGNFYYSKETLLIQDDITEYNNHFYQSEFFYSEVNP